jgi:hypothetical protein
VPLPAELLFSAPFWEWLGDDCGPVVRTTMRSLAGDAPMLLIELQKQTNELDQQTENEPGRPNRSEVCARK